MSTAIRLDDVSFAHRGVVILEHINLTVPAGEFLGIVGPNGSGKTTLLRLMLGLLEPDSGQIEVLGGAPKQARRAVGYVPQFVSFARDFPISVVETVMMGRIGQTRAIGGFTAADRRAAHRALEETGIAALHQRPIGALSGGELQRVLIARALAVEPELLLLDEPTSNVDVAGEEDIFDLLQRIDREMTIAVVSHDVGFISEYVTRVACVNRTLACHPTSEVTPENIQALYGHGVHVIDHSAAGEPLV